MNASRLARSVSLSMLVAGAVGGGGCGSSPPPASMTMTVTDPAPPSHGFQMKTVDFTVPAGKEEYLCYTVTLAEAADVAVTKFDSFDTRSIHHFEVFETEAPEQDGLFDCSAQLIKMSWLPLFGGGVGAGGLTLPDGAGFKLKSNTQLLLQLHLLNATTAPVTEHVIVNMTYAADPTTVTPAGIFALGSMNIDLPAGATGTTVNSSCNLPLDLNVFAVQPHMHTLGTKIVLATGTDEKSMTTAYQRDPWVFGVQPIDPITMKLTNGEYASMTCTYDNTTDHTVSYGESTKDEMCYFVLFYTPFNSLNGCID